MRPAREAVMTALFNQLLIMQQSPSNPTGAFVTISRRLKLWTDTPVEQQPALFLVEHHEETSSQNPGMNSRDIMNAMIWIYASAPEGTVGGTILNNLLDAVDNALSPTDISVNMNTLGGLISRMYIDGPLMKDPGDLDGQALAVIPVKLLIPGGLAL